MTITLVNRKRLLTWINRLKYNPTKSYKGWTWVYLPEHNYYERNREYSAIKFLSLDMKQGRLIYFEVDNGCKPSLDRVKDTIDWLNNKLI